MVIFLIIKNIKHLEIEVPSTGINKSNKLKLSGFSFLILGITIIIFSKRKNFIKN